MTELPEHDNDTDLGKREDFFANLARRLDDQNYLTAREHFDKHIAEDSVETAYLCLCKMLMMYLEGINLQFNQIYKAATGDDMNERVTREE